MTSRVISREFAKGPLDLPLPREQAAFKHVFGSIRNIEAFRRLHDPIRLALHHCRHFVFELVVQQGRCGHQQNDGLIGDGDRYRQVLAARFSMRQLDGDVVLRHGLNPDPVRALHHEPIAPDVLHVVIIPVVGVARNNAGLVNVEAPVSPVEAEQRHQVEQIDVVFYDDFLPRRGRDAFKLAGKLLEATDKLEKLITPRVVLVHAEGKGMVGPGAMHVHRNLGIGATGDVVENDRRAVFTHACQRAGGSREIRFKFDLVGNTHQLLLLLEHGQKFPQILISTHRLASRLVLVAPACRQWSLG